VVENRFGAFAQEAFFAARRLEFVREALVATCDESFLSLCLDDHKEVVKQAYFFQSVGGSGSRPPIQSRGDRPDREGAASAEVGGVPFETHGKQTAADAVSYRLMNASEFQLVRDHSDDFFEESLSRQLDAGRIHGGFLGDEPVAFGIIEPGGIRKDVASIGMFTKPTHRRRGFGRATLLYLSRRCRERDLEPVAGCWYYNHLSKKTLESAGFITKTRYLRIRF
jgi:GNAT superfamily N-acetyltransferase